MRINHHWKLITSTLLASALLTACGGEESNKQASLDTAAESTTGLAAPIARIENATDTHWGVEVDDPYRYMEDQDDPEVLEWFKGQAEYTESVLAGSPIREEIYERLIELDQGAPYSTFGVRRLANGEDGAPVLLRVEFDAGHGIGSTRDQVLSEVADTYSFLFSQLDKGQH